MMQMYLTFKSDVPNTEEGSQIWLEAFIPLIFALKTNVKF